MLSDLARRNVMNRRRGLTDLPIGCADDPDRCHRDARTRQVPAFTPPSSPKAADYCVCVFVINENGKLHKQLAAMRDHCAERGRHRRSPTAAAPTARPTAARWSRSA